MTLLTIRYLFLILFSVTFSLNAQTVHVLTNKPLLTTQAQALNTAGADYHWLQVIVDNPYLNDEKRYISISLPLNYTFYYSDRGTGKWAHKRAGWAIPDGQRDRGAIPYVFRAGQKDTLYFKLDLRDVRSYGYTIKPVIMMEQDVSYNSREKIIWYSWLASIVVLTCFMFYNLYLYFNLKDPVCFYYAVVQVGGIIFITAFKHFFNLFIPVCLYNVRLTEDGFIHYFGINAFLLHVGSKTLLSGIIQITRAYLGTSKQLPVFDKILKYLLYSYIVFGLLPGIITITGIYYLDSYTLLWDNVFIVLIAATIILTCIVSHRRKVKTALVFLLANIVPLILLTCMAIYFVFNTSSNYVNNYSILPELAILSQLFTFSIALIARMRSIDDELQSRDLEIRKLEADIAAATDMRVNIEKENEIINFAIQQERDKSDALLQELDVNKRELVSNSLYIHQKNKLLFELKKQMQDMHKRYPELTDIKSSLSGNNHLDLEWYKFKIHFEQVHPRFFDDLRTNYPSLTNNEMRLQAYLHIRLSTKEIAALLNIEPASVRQAKARLSKKMSRQVK